MIKELKKFQIKLTPFQAVKEWELDNVHNENLVLLEQTGSDGKDEALALEFVDYGDGSGPPITNSFCDIALEQQDKDLAYYREGKKLSGPFYPDTDPQNFDGTYKRVVYFQINTTFYNTYRNPTQIWGIENIDFELSKTKRKITDQVRLWSIPPLVFGDKIVPGSVQLYDPTQDNEYAVFDDSYGNLFIGTNLFSKQQELRVFGNSFSVGSDSTCDDYFSFVVGSAPKAPFALTASQVDSLENVYLNWEDDPADGFVVERALFNGPNEWETVFLNWENISGLWEGNILSQSFSTLLFTGANVTWSNDTSVNVGGTYWYRVYAFNDFGVSPYSNIATASVS